MLKLTREEELIIFFLLFSFLAGLGIKLGGGIPKKEVITRFSSSFEEKIVNLNTATFEELLSLPGIGPKLAREIIRYREEKGGFSSPTELKKIKGIGEKKYEKLKKLIQVKGENQ